MRKWLSKALGGLRQHATSAPGSKGETARNNLGAVVVEDQSIENDSPFRFEIDRRFRVWKRIQYGSVKEVANQTEALAHLQDPIAVAVVFGGSIAKLVQFKCPCGCGEILRINVSETGPRPLWRYHIDRQNRISLYPSVDRTSGCKSHFVLSNNVARLLSSAFK